MPGTLKVVSHAHVFLPNVERTFAWEAAHRGFSKAFTLLPEVQSCTLYYTSVTQRYPFTIHTNKKWQTF